MTYFQEIRIFLEYNIILKLCLQLPSNIMQKSGTFNDYFPRKWQHPEFRHLIHPSLYINILPRYDIILKLYPLLPSTFKQQIKMGVSEKIAKKS